MELLSSDIKASLQPGTTEEGQHHTSLTKIDCCLSKINQAIETIEKVLFSDDGYNQNTHLVAECDDNSYITTEDKVKLLSAQVESLKQQLVAKESELQATQQELNYTNQDLVAALKPDILTLESAKELAKNFLLSEQSISECLAKLLSAIYNLSVEASELAPINKLDKDNLMVSKYNRDNRFNGEFNNFLSMNEALKGGSVALRVQCMTLRNKAAELKAKSKDIIDRTASLKNK